MRYLLLFIGIIITSCSNVQNPSDVQANGSESKITDCKALVESNYSLIPRNPEIALGFTFEQTDVEVNKTLSILIQQKK